MKKVPKIKICGITNKSDALDIASFKPDYLGFILNYPKSARNIERHLVKDIVSEIKSSSGQSILCVGVFVDQDVKEVGSILSDCGLDVAQLHGEETPEYISELKKICQKNFEIWKTVIVKNMADKEKIKIYRGTADRILLDRGLGSGQKVELSILKDETVDVLAGGLGVENIQRIISKISPHVVDANSKLESSPGKKDINLVKEFIRKVRMA